MILKYLLESFDFDEIFPAVAEMYPNARRHRREFEQAFDLLLSIRPATSKQVIRFQLIEGSRASEAYFGAHDTCFRATWDVLLGKNVVKEKGVDLSDEEMAANCLLNAIFIGKHPQAFEQAYQVLVRA